ncbi:MAG: PHB depolymerase family esterase [Solirubrobacteraceae bacterium]
MSGIDWRQLYAANRAAIARADVPTTDGVGASPGPRRWAGPRGALPTAERLRTGVDKDLRVLVHVPRSLDTATPAPLVCMLHGCTQDPNTFAAATLMNAAADRHGFVVVYPGQNRGANAQGCWNWFLPGHQQRDAGQPAAIAAIVGDLVQTGPGCTIDPRRVFVAGLSAGGAMAAVLVACYPDVFAAAAVHSGLAYRSATSTSSAFEAMKRGPADAAVPGRAAHAAMGAYAQRVPSIVIHGNDDRTVAPINAIHVLRQSMDANRRAAPAITDLDPAHPTRSWRAQTDHGYGYTCSQWLDGSGALMHELLMVDGLGHAWSGGAAGGSFTDPRGPDATDGILEFFATTSAGSRAP